MASNGYPYYHNPNPHDLNSLGTPLPAARHSSTNPIQHQAHAHSNYMAGSHQQRSYVQQPAPHVHHAYGGSADLSSQPVRTSDITGTTSMAGSNTLALDSHSASMAGIDARDNDIATTTRSAIATYMQRYATTPQETLGDRQSQSLSSHQQQQTAHEQPQSSPQNLYQTAVNHPYQTSSSAYSSQGRNSPAVSTTAAYSSNYPTGSANSGYYKPSPPQTSQTLHQSQSRDAQQLHAPQTSHYTEQQQQQQQRSQLEQLAEQSYQQSLLHQNRVPTPKHSQDRTPLSSAGFVQSYATAGSHDTSDEQTFKQTSAGHSQQSSRSAPFSVHEAEQANVPHSSHTWEAPTSTNQVGYIPPSSYSPSEQHHQPSQHQEVRHMDNQQTYDQAPQSSARLNVHNITQQTQTLGRPTTSKAPTKSKSKPKSKPILYLPTLEPDKSTIPEPPRRSLQAEQARQIQLQQLAHAEVLRQRALERERIERQQAEGARQQAEREQAERAAREQAEREQVERKQAEKETAEREKAERQHAEKLRAEQERVGRERAERERTERERAERERAERQRAERERAERERAEQERVKAERAQAERAQAEQRRQQQLEQEKQWKQYEMNQQQLKQQEQLKQQQSQQQNQHYNPPPNQSSRQHQVKAQRPKQPQTPVHLTLQQQYQPQYQSPQTQPQTQPQKPDAAMSQSPAQVQQYLRECHEKKLQQQHQHQSTQMSQSQQTAQAQQLPPHPAQTDPRQSQTPQEQQHPHPHPRTPQYPQSQQYTPQQQPQPHQYHNPPSQFSHAQQQQPTQYHAVRPASTAPPAPPAPPISNPPIPMPPPVPTDGPVDHAMMEQHMRALVETMRFYQQKDPSAFSSVWENVRKESASRAALTAGGDPGRMRQRTTTPRAQIRAVTSPPVPAPVPVVQTVDPSQLVVVPPPSRMPRNFEDGSQSGPSSAVFGSAANTESGINVGEGANTINVPPATETPTTAPISEITASSIPAAATTTATAGVNVTATSPTVKMKAVKGKSSTPRKRGRPRKNPLPEETPTASPSVALENKPQQSPTRQQNQVSPPAPQAYPPPQTMPNHQVLDPVSNPPPPPPQQQQSPHVVAKPATPGPRPQPTASTRHWLSDKLIMADVSTKVISRMTGVLVPVEPVRAFLETTNNFVSLCEYFEAHGARFDRSAFANTLLSMTGPPMPNPVVAEQQVQVPQVAPPVKAPPPPPPSRAPQAPALVPPSAGRMVDTISHKDQPMIDAPPSHAHKAPYMQPLYGVSPAPQTPALATRCISEDKPRFFSSLPSHSPVLAPKADANLPPNTFVIEDSPSPPAPFADFPAPQPDHSMAGPTFHTPKPHKGPAVLTKPTASSSSVPRRILTPVSKLSVTSGINRQSLNASSDKGSVIDLTGTSGADGSFDEYTQPWSRPMSPIVPLVIDGKRTEPPAKMMQRTKASRVSRYDPTNIARSILLASGKHPTERPLNAHLFPLKENIGLTWQTDLETIRWDILDPEPKNGNIDVQTNGNGTSRTQAKSNLNDPTAGGTSQVMSLMEINDHDGSIPNGHNEERRASITYHAVSDKESLKNFANARRSRKSTSKSELGGMASSPTTTTPRPNDNAHLSRDAPSSAPARNPPAGLDANLPLTASRSTHQPFHHTPSASARSDDDMLITRTAIANGPKFREYPCDWQGCKAVLHNFEALSMHVQKVHLPRSPTTCHWTPCAGVVKFDNPSEWAMHMHVVHLDPIRQSIGVGPAVLPTGTPGHHPPLPLPTNKTPSTPADAPRAGITGQVNYLVDAEGNQVTPIARPAPKGWVHTTPVGTKRSRMWAETHNTNSEPKRVRGSVNSQTHHETLDRARQFGSGMETQDFTIEAERDDGTGLDADIIR